MMTYLLKFILCSGLLYTFYHLVLRNDKLFHFNRFFLLSIIILAAVIPVVTVKTKTVEFIPGQTVSGSTTALADQEPVLNSAVNGIQLPGLNEVVIGVFFVVTAFLLLRLVLNLWSINRFKKGGETTNQNGVKLVLRSDVSQSFSFMGYMFTNKEQYEQGLLPKEVIAHEKAHINQRHSFDVLIIELMICLCWFNPVVFLIKRAIQLNHEFLADEAAISETGALVQYQNIIIHFASQQIILNPRLVSHLSFGETKKRIIIMTKTQNKRLNLARQITAMLVVITLFVSLGEAKVIAQEPAGKIITTSVPFLIIKDGVPKQRPVKAQDTKQNDERLPAPPIFVRDMLQAKSKVRYTDTNGKIVIAIFEELPSSVQKEITELKVATEIHLPPTLAAPITQDMLNDFKDAQRYGVWIDGSRVDNTVLDNHKVEDFHHYFKSRLSKRAKNYGQYTYHLTLVTQKAFEKVPANINGRWISYTTLMAKARKLVKPDKDQN